MQFSYFHPCPLLSRSPFLFFFFQVEGVSWNSNGWQLWMSKSKGHYAKQEETLKELLKGIFRIHWALGPANDWTPGQGPSQWPPVVGQEGAWSHWSRWSNITLPLSSAQPCPNPQAQCQMTPGRFPNPKHLSEENLAPVRTLKVEYLQNKTLWEEPGHWPEGWFALIHLNKPLLSARLSQTQRLLLKGIPETYRFLISWPLPHLSTLWK